MVFFYDVEVGTYADSKWLYKINCWQSENPINVGDNLQIRESGTLSHFVGKVVSVDHEQMPTGEISSIGRKEVIPRTLLIAKCNSRGTTQLEGLLREIYGEAFQIATGH
jgi:hypothetical protein